MRRRRQNVLNSVSDITMTHVNCGVLHNLRNKVLVCLHSYIRTIHRRQPLNKKENSPTNMFGIYIMSAYGGWQAQVNNYFLSFIRQRIFQKPRLKSK
jgi:hypothetical protein